jgi:hypothetical protein
LNNGDYAFRQFVLEPAGLLSMPSASAVSPAPVPGEGTFRKGNLWYYRYKDAEIHHWDMGKILKPFLQATLVPYWSGKLSSGSSTSRPLWLEGLVALAGIAATLWVVNRVAKGGSSGGRGDGQSGGARARGGRDEVG